MALIAVAACSGPHSAVQRPSGDPGAVSRGGQLTVTWSPPTRNTDGTPLKNLAGYTLLFGTASKTYSTAISIDDPTATRYVVGGLSPGTYYFALSAINSTGRHSVLSAEASGKVH
jgi:hypothetical protein